MKDSVDKKIHKTLSKKHLCYVLITCTAPQEDGSMQVEMNYEGDATLASYLIKGAQEIIDEKEREPKSSCAGKIVRF